MSQCQVSRSGSCYAAGTDVSEIMKFSSKLSRKRSVNSVIPSRAAFELKTVDRFRHRTRYFPDSGVIGEEP
jgi:hypothetical protein